MDNSHTMRQQFAVVAEAVRKAMGAPLMERQNAVAPEDTPVVTAAAYRAMRPRDITQEEIRVILDIAMPCM